MNITGEAAEKAPSAQCAQPGSPAGEGSNEEGNDSSSSGSNAEANTKSGSPVPPHLDAHYKTARLQEEERASESVDIEHDMETSIFIPKFV